MRSLFFIASVLLTVSPSISQNKPENSDLPELHKIKKITLSPSYSCRSKEDFQKGYASTALFLSKSSRDPDLLFNGACGSRDNLQGSTAGDEMTVIADLGNVRLEDLNASQAFNVQRVNSPELFSKFTSEAQIEFGHTYAVLIDKPDERGLFYFTIAGYIPNERLDLRYSVKEYQLLEVRAQSPGFDWEGKSN
jgi:hypothetical protein